MRMQAKILLINDYGAQLSMKKFIYMIMNRQQWPSKG